MQALVTGDIFRYAKPHPSTPETHFCIDVPITFVGPDHPAGLGIDVDFAEDCSFQYTDLDSANAFEARLKAAVQARAAALGYPVQRIIGPGFRKL